MLDTTFSDKNQPVNDKREVKGLIQILNSDLEELYQEIILDHSRKPRNFGELPDASVRVHGSNPICGDEIHLAVKFGTDGGFDDIKFTGHGCTISQASASLITMKLKGKGRNDAASLLNAFKDLIVGESNTTVHNLGDLRLLRGVRKFPERVKCVMLAARAVEQALQQSSDRTSVATEGEW